jgi:hypothetical protein
VNGAGIGERARQVMELFAKGLGHTRTASLESQVARYARADRDYFAPFIRRHPHILENLLVNSVLRDAFPFGKALIPAGGNVEPTNAFAMMSIQFALIKGLLIGVAGARGRWFGSSDVVKVVQVASRLFEHNPTFLRNAFTMLESRGLTDAHGLALLLRN